uniref:Dolichyl-P-Glc:Glc(2)Man(9)GlcNAc(2)-PP-dolichol alpha-1,2-glucosyltransferase n=1 Tax=Echinostoma caproni TaxID=27848 RepID=A0A183A3L5_9TREM
LPFFGMWLCAVLSASFSFEEVTESHFKVSNFIPSISAATGITPQLYFWRYAIGFHSAPRILLAAAYYQYYKMFTECLSYSFYYNLLTKMALLLNILDVITFLGVAFGLFIIFLFASSLYMLTVLTIHEILRKHNMLSSRVCYSRFNYIFLQLKHSYTMKFTFFISTLILIGILAYHFHAHRFLCRPNGEFHSVIAKNMSHFSFLIITQHLFNTPRQLSPAS